MTRLLDRLAAWWLRRRGWKADRPLYSSAAQRLIMASHSNRKPVVVDTKWFYVGDKLGPYRDSEQ